MGSFTKAYQPLRVIIYFGWMALFFLIGVREFGQIRCKDAAFHFTDGLNM